MITPLGVLLLVALIVAAATSIGFTRLLAATAGVPVGVSLLAAGESLTLFYTLGLGVAAYLVWRVVTARRQASDPFDGGLRFPGRLFLDRPGSRALLAMIVYSAAITLVAPTIFWGTPVVVARGGLDTQLVDPGTLDYSVSNVAQLGYLIIGACVVIFIAHSRSATAGLVGIPLAVLSALSSWRLLHRELAVPFPDRFFDNSTNVRFIESTPEGAERFRGIFAEPSGLAEGSLATIAFFTMRLPYLSVRAKIGAFILIALAAWNGAVSTSATFVLAGVVFVAVLVAFGAVHFILRSGRLGALGAAASCFVVCASAITMPMLLRLVDEVVSAKVGSSSFTSRSGVDQFSLELVLKTWGLGLGVGSNRPSSLIASSLSCIGIVGTLAYFTFIAIVIRGSWRFPDFRPTTWALVSILISKVIAGPSLLDPIPALCLGVLASTRWRPAAGERVVGSRLQGTDRLRFIPRSIVGPPG